MTENRENTAALDRMLEQMARETPEMPADFHARWTEAIRAEAGEAPRTETGKHREGRRQLRYILSAAAVFIFLIGGTLLTRSMNQTDLVNKPAAITAAPAEKTDAAVTAIEKTDETGAVRPEIQTGAAVQSNDMDAVQIAEDANAFAAMEAPAAGADSGALMAASSAKSASNESSVKAGGEAAMNAEADMAVGAVMESNMAATDSREYAEEADRAVEDAEEENALQMAAPTATETAAPTATAVPTATAAPTTEPTLAPTAEPTAAPAAESEFVSFLKDLGSFTLKTLAVAAAAAALAFGAAAIHKALKKRGQKKG